MKPTGVQRKLALQLGVRSLARHCSSLQRRFQEKGLGEFECKRFPVLTESPCTTSFRRALKKEALFAQMDFIHTENCPDTNMIEKFKRSRKKARSCFPERIWRFRFSKDGCWELCRAECRTNIWKITSMSSYSDSIGENRHLAANCSSA